MVRNFEIEWKALKAKKSEDDPDVPTMTGTTVMKWNESFVDYLHQCIGARNIPLAYVICKNTAVPVTCPALANNKPHLEEHGLIEADTIARGLHTGAAYQHDNKSVYFKLEEATRSTNKAATIKPFQRTKDSRAAYLALIAQHASKDQWHALIQQHNKILHNVKWKGNMNYFLDKHCQQQRNSFAQIVHAAEHVPYEVPNDHTRVTYLFKSIENSDPGLQAAIARVNQNNDVLNFEMAVEKILPADPVLKKRTAATKCPQGEISAVSFANNANLKSRIGDTGVHFWYYKPNDCKKLSKEQQEELQTWRNSPEGQAAITSNCKGGHKKPKPIGKPKTKGKDNNHKKAIASAVQKHFQLIAEKKEQSDTETLLMSVLQQAASKPASAVAPAVSSAAIKPPTIASALKAILG